MKHEALFEKPVGSEKEVYPYLGRTRDLEQVSYKEWLRVGMDCESGATWSPQGRGQLPPESSFLAGKGGGLDDDGKNSRMSLPLVVQRLQKRVDLDWEGTTVVVTATDQDLVQVAFHMATVDSERGVQAYMGVLSKDDSLLGNLGIRKLSQLWGVVRDFTPEEQAADSDLSEHENTWMFFLFMPKWVRMRPTDAYYTVHPREEGSAFRMSSAGSSVLLSTLGAAVVNPSPSASMRTTTQSTVRASSAGGGPTAPQQKIGKVDLSVAMKAANALPPIREARGAQTAR